MKSYLIKRFGSDYVLFYALFEGTTFCARSKHVQLLFDLIPKEEKFNLEIKN